MTRTREAPGVSRSRVRLPFTRRHDHAWLVALAAGVALASAPAPGAAPAFAAAPVIAVAPVTAAAPLTAAAPVTAAAADTTRAGASATTPAPASSRLVTPGSGIVPAGTVGSEVYLAWHAPYGEPRATDALAVSCGDSTAADTLWLSFKPGRGSPAFAGFSATLMFRPVGPDSLGNFWRTGCGTPLPAGFSARFDPDLGYRQPWRVQGAGGTFYDCREGGARLRMVWAVPANQASGINADTLLALGRIVIHHPPARFARCNEPVCIEWTEAELVYEVGAWGAVKLAHQGDHRFVSWNATGSDVCAPLRGHSVIRPKPWSPKAGGAK